MAFRVGIPLSERFPRPAFILRPLWFRFRLKWRFRRFSIDFDKVATAIVTIVPQVNVTPNEVMISGNETLQFALDIKGVTDTDVVWAVNGIPGGNSSIGTISDSGFFRAPSYVRFFQTSIITATIDGNFTGRAIVKLSPQIELFILDRNGNVLRAE